MKTGLFFSLLMVSLIVSNSTAFEINKGTPIIEMYGGGLGNISFPHQKHQNALEDCGLCHNLFPQEAGSIEKLKADEKLAKKQVMEQCRDCHRENTAKGETAGPASHESSQIPPSETSESILEQSTLSNAILQQHV